MAAEASDSHRGGSLEGPHPVVGSGRQLRRLRVQLLGPGGRPALRHATRSFHRGPMCLLRPLGAGLELVRLN